MEDLKIKDDLIYLDEKCIGFLEYSPDYSSFRNIEIDEEYRGEGYGKKLLEYGLKMLKKKQIE
jgi:ribosomal protein S18 acetylase RimI-like enzyme